MPNSRPSGVTGSYPAPKRPVGRRKEVLVLTHDQGLEQYVEELTREVNAVTHYPEERVTMGEMTALLALAIISRISYVMGLSRDQLRQNGVEGEIRRMDDSRWRLPASFAPLLASIGRVVGGPVDFYPAINATLVERATPYLVDPLALVELEDRLARLEALGVTIVRATTRDKDGNPDVMSSLMASDGLYFTRPGVEGATAAIASIAGTRISDVDQVVIESALGIAALQTWYTPSDVEKCAREYARGASHVARIVDR